MFPPQIQNAATAQGANAVENANTTQCVKTVDEPNPITSSTATKSSKRQRKTQSTDLNYVLAFDAVGLIANLYKIPYGSFIPVHLKKSEPLSDTDRY